MSSTIIYSASKLLSQWQWHAKQFAPYTSLTTPHRKKKNSTVTSLHWGMSACRRNLTKISTAQKQLQTINNLI
jgi:hypothetical protein